MIRGVVAMLAASGCVACATLFFTLIEHSERVATFAGIGAFFTVLGILYALSKMDE